MNLFPDLTIPVSDYPSTQLPIYKEWAYDFEKNEFKLRGGLYYLVEKNEALRIWVYKALKTPRYRFQAYPREYGSELEEVVGLCMDREILESEVERFIREALLTNPYIISVQDFIFTYGDKTTVSFSVTTVYGDMEESEDVTELYG